MPAAAEKVLPFKEYSSTVFLYWCVDCPEHDVEAIFANNFSV